MQSIAPEQNITYVANSVIAWYNLRALAYLYDSMATVFAVHAISILEKQGMNRGFFRLVIGSMIAAFAVSSSVAVAQNVEFEQKQQAQLKGAKEPKKT